MEYVQDLPADANPERTYGTQEFEARRGIFGGLARRHVRDLEPAAPILPPAAALARWKQANARLNRGKPQAAFPSTPPAVAAPCPEPEPDRKMVAHRQRTFIYEAPIEPIMPELEAACRMTMAAIIRAVSAHYGVSVVDILSQRRDARVMRPRLVCYHLARSLTLKGFPEIARRMGGRDHTSVMSGCRKVLRLIENGDAALVKEIADITEALGAKA
ncbi:helix-turn-helix domain-containing protein [Ancylobacter oerskovii]|uniref:Helix-turn-helix domain-containing protein n=1 Tax=Ancylobacter oerskovii TaxID=459519 RepID=A0ABW4Z1E3_9HYPH|nr:helix-turn-helix domain-containing protein [Ancylobacter oerskovii]MBS7545099.1 hypothetical protein [Ancylobacter oerskovii]